MALYNTILTSIGVVGLGIGSLTGGRISSMLGLRKSLILSTFLNIIANAIKIIYLSYPTLVIGRLLNGLGSGVISFC